MIQFQKEREDLHLIQRRNKEIQANIKLVSDMRALQEEWTFLVQQLEAVTSNYRHRFCEKMRHRRLREVLDEEIRECRETSQLLATVANELQVTREVCRV